MLGCTAACLLDASGCTLPSAGDGADGDLTVSDRHVLPDGLGPAYGVSALGSDRVTVVGGPPVLTAGDEVLLVNLQGDSLDCAAAGAYEFAAVGSVDGDDVVLQSTIQGAYGVGGANGDLTGQKVVLQRVPHFARVHVTATGTVTGRAWDGASGGLLVMRISEELRIEPGGAVDVDGLGFRGGMAITNDDRRHGRQGESLCGNPQAHDPTPNHGGGGGGKFMDPGDGCGQGGGGGAFGLGGTWELYATSCIGEGNDDPALNGGSAYGQPDLTRLLFGSGGGSGGTDEDSQSSGGGGAAGGAILVFASHFVHHGRLSARGADGGVGSDTNDSGNGGGGAGGGIYLRVGTLEGTGSISAAGGLGPAPQTSWNSEGGDGGAGRIRIDYHDAGGHPWGTSAATGFVANMAEPDPAHAELCLD